MRFTITTESPLHDDVRVLVRALNEFTYALTPAEFRHHMSVEQMAAADTTVFVARDASGAAIGMGALRRHDGAGEVKRMFVLPSTRGTGLGGAILAEIEKLARAEGFSKLVLETGSNFDSAKRVYERAGFVTCDAVLDYPPSPWTAFYAKDLGA
jgi:putative acetyltransferase